METNYTFNLMGALASLAFLMALLSQFIVAAQNGGVEVVEYETVDVPGVVVSDPYADEIRALQKHRKKKAKKKKFERQKGSDRRGGKGGKGENGKKSKGKSSKGGGPSRNMIPNVNQTCTLFEFFDSLERCPESDYFCPQLVPDRHRRRLESEPLHVVQRKLKGKKGGKGGRSEEGSDDDDSDGFGDSVVCIDSFGDYCAMNFECEGGDVPCIDVIQDCCEGWCESALTLAQRCDFFDIVSADATGPNCDIYFDVLCPDENQIDYACTDATTFGNYCHTYVRSRGTGGNTTNTTEGEDCFADCQASFDCCCSAAA